MYRHRLVSSYTAPLDETQGNKDEYGDDWPQPLARALGLTPASLPARSVERLPGHR